MRDRICKNSISSSVNIINGSLSLSFFLDHHKLRDTTNASLSTRDKVK